MRNLIPVKFVCWTTSGIKRIDQLVTWCPMQWLWCSIDTVVPEFVSAKRARTFGQGITAIALTAARLREDFVDSAWTSQWHWYFCFITGWRFIWCCMFVFQDIDITFTERVSLWTKCGKINHDQQMNALESICYLITYCGNVYMLDIDWHSRLHASSLHMVMVIGHILIHCGHYVHC